jgi:uncharacterized membrane protein
MRDFDKYQFYGPGPRFFGAGHLIGFLFMLAILGLLIYIAIATFRRTRGFGTVARGPAAGPPSSESPTLASPAFTPLEVAKMRYAKGEITKEEFETLRQDLQ